MGLVAKLAGRGDPIAQLEKEIGKHARDLALAEAELVAAHEAHDGLFASGESDDAIDAAQRTIALCQRKIQRGKLKGQALANQLAELKSKARAELRLALKTTAREAGVAYGEDGRRAAQTAARYVTAIGEMQARGFASDAAAFPQLPMTVLDFGSPSPVHDMLERFVFLINSLRDGRAAS